MVGKTRLAVIIGIVTISMIAVAGMGAVVAQDDNTANVGPSNSTPDSVANFTNTSPVADSNLNNNSLSGKFRVESDEVNSTYITLDSNSTTEYSVLINNTNNASNVTIFTNKNAIENSQNISEFALSVNGTDTEFYEGSTVGNSGWVAYEVDFSTKEVTFSVVGGSGGGSNNLLIIGGGLVILLIIVVAFWRMQNTDTEGPA